MSVLRGPSPACWTDRRASGGSILRQQTGPKVAKLGQCLVDWRHEQPRPVAPQQPELVKPLDHVAAFEIDADAECCLKPFVDPQVQLLFGRSIARKMQEFVGEERLLAHL